MENQLTKEEIKKLKLKAVEIRKKIVNLTVIAGGSHIGGALSMVEILIALYYKILNIDPKNPQWEDRDRFILSKGHGCVGICPVLCDRGYFDEKNLSTFNQFKSPFGMHPDMHKIPGIEMSTGSLGHGLSVCVGLAIANKLNNSKWKIYCLLGDGECNEGSVWEAAMSASHFKLNNIIAIVDRNKFEIDGPTEKIMALEPFKEKWLSFGWNVKEVDGHDFEQLINAFYEIKNSQSEKPSVIIANTIKGKGVSYMEGQAKWHYGGLSKELEEQAMRDLNNIEKQILAE